MKRSVGQGGESTGVKSAVAILVAGLLWAIAYGLAWAVAWFAFMRAEWYGALAVGDRMMPWVAIWSVWAVLNVPLGMATAAYFRARERRNPQENALVPVVLVLWVPMTVDMTAWAWYESLSLTMIALDSAVNLVGLALASQLARPFVRELAAPTTVSTES